MHEATFLKDLAYVLVAAATSAVIFRMMRLPALMGYLLAGMLIGPHLFESSLIQNQDVMRELSELGVVFLMFYIGMEFELDRVRRILAPALIAVILQTIATLMLGLMAAPMLGWGRMEGLFLGGLLAISSSMVTLQVFRERGLMNFPHAQLAIGILVLEDILAIALLVILSGVGVSGMVVWADIWQITFLIGVFVVAVYVFGRLLAPPLLNLLHRIGSPEIITLVTMAMVLGVGELAAGFHFSVALGAFLAGAILSRSSLADDIEELTEPLRMLFTAVFFVSVGMWIDPMVLISQWKAVLALTAAIILAKTLTCFCGLAATGCAPRSSLRAALGKAQIGEFSFVIAALGESLGVTGKELTAVAAGVALLTILLTYPISSNSLRLYQFARRHTPDILVHWGRSYQSMLRATGEAVGRIALLRLIKRPLLATLGYFFIFNAIVLLAAVVSAQAEHEADQALYQVVIWSVAALAVLPVVGALVRNLDAALLMITEAVMAKSNSGGRLRERLSPVLYTLSWTVIATLSGGIFIAAAANVFPSGWALGIFATLVLAMSLFFWRRIGKLNSRMECLFLESFNQQANSISARKRESARKNIQQRYPWAVNILEVNIAADSEACGKSIRELNLREETGALVIALCRHQYTLFDPSPDSPIFPEDQVVLMGTPEQTSAAQTLLNKASTEQGDRAEFGAFEIDSVFIEKDSLLVGDTLAGANLRRRFGVTVIGIQRGETRITSPAAGEMIHAHDLFWVAGKHASIESLQEAAGEDRKDTATEADQ